MPPILKAVDLTKRFPGVIANEDVNFDLVAGESTVCSVTMRLENRPCRLACLAFIRPEVGISTSMVNGKFTHS